MPHDLVVRVIRVRLYDIRRYLKAYIFETAACKARMGSFKTRVLNRLTGIYFSKCQALYEAFTIYLILET